jgi:hypothetical protein
MGLSELMIRFVNDSHNYNSCPTQADIIDPVSDRHAGRLARTTIRARATTATTVAWNVLDQFSSSPFKQASVSFADAPEGLEGPNT